MVVIVYSDFSKYDGETKNDKPNGIGIHTFPDNSRYEGGYKDGKFHGKGVFTFPDGTTLSGEWIKGKTQGKVVYTFKDGTKFETQHEAGEQKESNCVFFAKNGDIYEGPLSKVPCAATL